MWTKCVMLLFLFSVIDIGECYTRSQQGNCPKPFIKNGHYRLRRRGKLVRFSCLPGYSLAGNRYATCRDGGWDTLPVCVKSGCKLSPIKNGLQLKIHDEAVLLTFCATGYKLVGSATLYCTGSTWNDTMPTCVATQAPPMLNCSFEDASLCGWAHDETHDFDWKRINRRTPSSFLFTGPSFDHTYGQGGSGYYMYIESTSRLENDTARLISPLYESSEATRGCFSFYYHMFGKTTGGLKVYQKPKRLPMSNLTEMSDMEKHKYTLFEKWGNQGDVWYRGVATLTDYDEDFQIVIEGIRGKSFTSDIAIDDVSLLSGNNCTVAMTTSTTTPTPSDSCAGRCEDTTSVTLVDNADIYGQCRCNSYCVYLSNCCEDFFDVCVFPETTSEELTTPQLLPQTQKLVRTPTMIAPVVTRSTSTSTSTSTWTTTSTTPMPVTSASSTSSSTILTLPVKPIVIARNPSIKPYTKVITKTTQSAQKTSTKPIPPKTIKSTSYTSKVVPKATTPAVTVKQRVTGKTVKVNDRMKLQQERDIESMGFKAAKTIERPPKQSSSALRTWMITLLVIAVVVGAACLAMRARGWRPYMAMTHLRARAASDPEVRYLNANADDD